MDIDDDDEVVAEYPLYAASMRSMYSQNEDEMRLVQLQYPMRPPWRGYDLDNMKKVTYQPKHRVLDMQLPEDQPAGRDGSSVWLNGRGRVPEAPICAMVKVDGAFVLMPIDEITTMRPDLAKFTAAEAARDAAAKAKAVDPDFKPSASSSGRAAAEAGTSDRGGQANLKTIKVEVQRRENERQAAQRMRSYTHLRQQMEKEPKTELKMHDLAEGQTVLEAACKSLIQKFSGEVAMRLPAGEFLRLVSPSTYVPQPTSPLAAAVVPPATAEAPMRLDKAELAAVKQALEALFQEQSVVTLPDVRVWLAAFSAAPKAQQAASLRDAALSALLLGGGSILSIRGRYVLKPRDDPFRGMVLELLEASNNGIRKADVMQEAGVRNLVVKDHEYGKVLRELCVAKGALWDLKEGASFQGFSK